MTETSVASSSFDPRRWARSIVIATVVLVGLYIVWVIILTPLRDESRRASGRNELAGARTCAFAYAEEHDGVLPPMDSEAGRLMFARDAMFPRYIRDASWISCPSARPARTSKGDDADFIDDHCVFYLGYTLENEEQGLAFLDAYKAQVDAGEGFESDFAAPEGFGSFGTNMFTRLSVNPNTLKAFFEERDFDLIQEQHIPVFIERPEHYRKPGGFVAYLDGSVKWHDYPGEWPMTERFIEGLRALDLLGRQES